MSNGVEKERVMDTIALPSTSMVLKEKTNLELPVEENKQNWTEHTESMELRTNASTDDLLFLESGSQTPEQVHTNFNVNTAASLESTEQIPQTTPHTTPSIRRKPRNTLRLDLDANTWSKQDSPTKAPTTTKLRQNLQAGAARVSAVVQKGILVNNLTWRLCHGCMYRSPRSRHGVPETIRQCSSIFARSCVVPSAWLFVTLLDGNYYVCLTSSAPCETESEENRRLVATSQIISWIFLVTTVAIATLVMIFSRCMDHMTFVHSRYLSVYRDAERQQFEELMTKKAQQLAKLNAEVFLNESKLQKEDWDAISMAPSYKVDIALDKEEEPLYTPLHKWAFRHQVPGK